MKKETISTEEYQQRLLKLRSKMREHNLDTIFVYSDEYRCGNTLYITGYKPINVIEESPQVVFLTLEDDPVVFLGNINTHTAKRVSWIKDIRPTTEIEETLRKYRTKVRRIGIVGENLLPLTIYKKVKEAFPEAEEISCPTLIYEMRLIKSNTEISLIERACELGDIGLRKGIEVLKEGMTEIQVCAETEYATRIRGGDLGCAYIVSAGRHMELPTWRPGPKIIERGELVMIDIAPSFKHYCTDVAVTVPVGKPTDEQCRTLQTCREIMLDICDNIQPGIPANSIYNKMRFGLRKAGYEEYFLPYAQGMRAIGHGVGLDVVEYPNLGPESDFELKSNMVLGVKLDLHALSFGGVRLEIVIEITADGCKPLNKILDDKLFINAVKKGI